VKPRIEARDGPTRLFALRGAIGSAPENSVDAFLQAKRLGADGVASEAWFTADGHAVLDREGLVGKRFRRRRVGSMDRVALPEHLVSVDDLYDLVEASMEVAIDVADPAAATAIVAAARRTGGSAEENLWLGHPDIETLTSWRRTTAAKLVLTTKMSATGGQPERLANQLRERGVDALRLPHGEWNAGLIAILHRFERYALATGLVHEREMAKLLDVGIDGILSGHVDRMVAVAANFSA